MNPDLNIYILRPLESDLGCQSSLPPFFAQVSVATDGASSNVPDPSSIVSSSSSITPSSTSSSSSSSSSPSSPENTLHRLCSLSQGACEPDTKNGASSVSAGPASQCTTTIGRFQVSTNTNATAGPSTGSKVGRFSVTGLYLGQSDLDAIRDFLYCIKAMFPLQDL